MKEDLNSTPPKVLTNTTIIHARRKDHTCFMSLLRRRSMMKIKVPKLLLKPMRVTKERCKDKDFDGDDEDDEHRSERKDKMVFADKVGSIFNNVLRFRKGRQSASSSSSKSSGNECRVHANDQGLFSSVSSLQDDPSESSSQIDTSSIRSTSPESKEDDEGKKSIVAALEQILKAKDDHRHQSFPRGLFADLSNSIGKRNSFKFIKGKMNKRTVSRRRVENKTGNATKEDGGGAEDSGGRSGRDDELCKKRILMGEKCRPLNSSGTLHYDKDGIILPEV